MRFVDFMKAEGLSPKQMAARIPCSEMSVYRYVNGAVPKTRDSMRRVFEATGGNVTPNDFYGVGPRSVRRKLKPVTHD